MARLPRKRIIKLLMKADYLHVSQKRGSLLEEAASILFVAIPGVEVVDRNVKMVANTEEIDLLCWNKRLQNGFYHIETPFLVECKNWGCPVPGHEIVYFANSMKSRACRDGILIASNGITGNPGTLNEAHFELAQALARGQRIIVLTRQEVESLTTSDQLANLLKQKILDLTINLTRIR